MSGPIHKARTLVRLLKSLSRLPSIESQLARGADVGFPPRTNPPFHLSNASEPTVQTLFRDFVRAGDAVFDVGAHIGVLTQVLSRMVGPKGHVISFEANPNTLPFLNSNIVKNAQFNCFIIPKVVYSQSRMMLGLAEVGAASKLSDEGTYRVATTTLDDICHEFDIWPTFVKMDIEGGEFDALKGATDLIARVRPFIVFEHSIGDDRAMNYLRDSDYWLMDAASYKEVASSKDFEPHIKVANIAAIPSEKRSQTKFSSPVVCQSMAQIDLSEAKPTGDAGLVREATHHLPRGRYCMKLSGTVAPGHTLYSRVRVHGVVIAQLWTESSYFMNNHRDLVFETDVDADCTFEVGEIGVAQPSLAIDKIDLLAIRFT